MALRHRALEDEETVTDILIRLATGYVEKKKKGSSTA
jgi:DNA polymerase III epsilon subunit-like protein